MKQRLCICFGTRQFASPLRQFAGHLGRSPDTASVDELRRYQLHLVKIERGRYLLFEAQLEISFGQPCDS